jgi:hypothetical protein
MKWFCFAMTLLQKYLPGTPFMNKDIDRQSGGARGKHTGRLPQRHAPKHAIPL